MCDGYGVIVGVGETIGVVGVGVVTGGIGEHVGIGGQVGSGFSGSSHLQQHLQQLFTTILITVCPFSQHTSFVTSVIFNSSDNITQH